MLIWAKNHFVLGRSDYHYQHEPILYGWIEGAHRWHGGHAETSIWQIDKPFRSDLHPTMKPLELYSRAITNSSMPGEIVLDNFCGSGPCLIACEQLERQARGCEIDPGYVAVALERWHQVTGQTPQLLTPAP